MSKKVQGAHFKARVNVPTMTQSIRSTSGCAAVTEKQSLGKLAFEKHPLWTQYGVDNLKVEYYK